MGVSILWGYRRMKTELIEALVKELPVTAKIAVGNDVVHLPTFVLSLTPQFIRRGYTADELAYISRFDDPVLRYASTWAAKEAVYKALKQSDDTLKLWWRDIEIQRAKPQGKPTVYIKRLKNPPEFSLTITHDGDYVWALVLMVNGGFSI